MKTFFFILIVFSGLQVYGYALVDVFLLGVFLFLITLTTKRSLKLKINWVLIFCIYMILQAFRGMYLLGDFRMFYWVFFFLVVYFSHLYLIGLAEKSRLNLDFAKMVFNYSLIYFSIYGVLAILFIDADMFQGIYWVGSSSAFIIVIPLVVSHFIIFQSSQFSLSQLKFPSLMIYMVVSIIHYSRMGLYLILLYLFYLTLRTFTFNFKKFVFMLASFALAIFIWDSTRMAFYVNPDSTGLTEISQVTSIVDDDSTLEETSNDVSRFLMVVSVYDKFVSSPQEFLFGSGWYTSRQTLKSFEIEVFDRFGLAPVHVSQNKPMQVTGFAAIISDVGLIGLLFIIYFFIKSSKQILQVNPRGKTIIIGFLFLNWVFYLVGFAFASIISFLLIFPNGLLVNLARANIVSDKYIR
jgi:hypothetical protein